MDKNTIHTIKQDKKEHILNTAEKVFAELGYEGASTRHLAGEAGVNMAMLNYYFGSKDGLFKAVLERRISSMRRELLQVKEQPIASWDKVLQVIDVYLNRVMLNNCFHRLIHRELSLSQRSEMGDFISEHVLHNVNIINSIIKEGIEEGDFKEVDVEMTISSVLGTMYYIINSSQVASKMLFKDFQDPEVMEKEIKPRIRTFLHDYLKVFLLKHDSQNESI